MLEPKPPILTIYTDAIAKDFGDPGCGLWICHLYKGNLVPCLNEGYITTHHITILPPQARTFPQAHLHIQEEQ